MNDRSVRKAEPKNARSIPPAWLAWIIAQLTPPNDRHGRKFILDDIWKEHPSLPEAVPRVAVALADIVYVHARDGLYTRMVAAQACILFLPFAGVMSAPLLLVLGLTFAALLIWEAYVRKDERLEHEIVTTFWTPALIVALHVLLEWKFPGSMMPARDLMPRITALSFAIGFFRYNFAPHAGPDHPYKDLMDLHHRVWFFNDLWIAGAFTCLMASELAAPAKWHVQAFLTVMPAGNFFIAAIRLQLNPIGGVYRHRRIAISLLTDPYEDELEMKRHYLLTGADWLRNFNLQSLYEVLAFALGFTPLLIGVLQWYVGDSNAARINWTQMAVNCAAWAGLVITWHYVKQLNRQTALRFDETLKALRGRRKNIFRKRAPNRPSQLSCL